MPRKKEIFYKDRWIFTLNRSDFCGACVYYIYSFLIVNQLFFIRIINTSRFFVLSNGVIIIMIRYNQDLSPWPKKKNCPSANSAIILIFSDKWTNILLCYRFYKVERWYKISANQFDLRNVQNHFYYFNDVLQLGKHFDPLKSKGKRVQMLS